MPTKILSAFVLTMLLVGCSEKAREDIVKDFKESYEEGFKKTYRSSFVASCVGESDSEEKKKFCECIADDLLSKFSSDELMDADQMKKYVQENAVANCSEKSE